MNWFSKIFQNRQQANFDGDNAESMRFASPLSIRRPRLGGGGHALPRFHSMVGGLDTGGGISASDKIRARLRKAFTPSQPVSDVDMFAGRHALLSKLIRLIEDQHLHVVIYGDRGIGKTSTLHVLAELARQARYTVAYASCGSGTHFSDLFTAMATEIPLLYHADYEPTSEEAERGDTFADTLPEGPLSVSQVATAFGKISGTRVLLIVDEFDRAASAHLREQVAELIKNMSDRSMVVQLVIAGVASNLTALVSHIPSIRRNIIGLPIDAMTREELRELLMNGQAVSGLAYPDGATDALIRYSNGSPYLANLLGQHAGLAAAEREGTEITIEDVRLALARALEEVRMRVSPRGLTSVERLITRVGLDRLNMLADIAMRNVGRVTQEQVPDLALTEVDAMLEPLADDAAGAWTFKEEVLVPFVWLQSQFERADRGG